LEAFLDSIFYEGVQNARRPEAVRYM